MVLDVQQLGHAVLFGCGMLLLNPVLYIGAVLWIWELLRNAKSERKFFGVRLTKVKGPLTRQFLFGIAAGLILSVLLCGVGAVVTEREVWVVSALCLILAMLRVRFFHVQYAVGILLFLHTVAEYVSLPNVSLLGTAVSFLRDFHAASWLAVVAGTTLMSAVLLWTHRRRGAAPAAVVGKRGGTIGAFVVQLSFLSAAFLPVPGTTMSLHNVPFGWPWLAVAGGGFSLVGLPLFTGISALYTSRRPEQGIRITARWHLLLGVLLSGCAYWTVKMNVYGAAVGALLCLLYCEVLAWWVERIEQSRDALFTESAQGVKVLDTVKGSVAHQMGLLPGEVITHVNQVPVHSTYDLHFAFEQNPAYAKLQVLDLRGEARFIGKPVYDGERHQLGIIFAPDTNDGFGYTWVKTGLFQSLYLRTGKQDLPTQKNHWKDASTTVSDPM